MCGYKVRYNSKNCDTLWLFYWQRLLQEQLEACRREMNALRGELEKLRIDRSGYYVTGASLVNDKLDDELIRRQHRGREWSLMDDPSKVAINANVLCTNDIDKVVSKVMYVNTIFYSFFVCPKVYVFVCASKPAVVVVHASFCVLKNQFI